VRKADQTGGPFTGCSPVTRALHLDFPSLGKLIQDKVVEGYLAVCEAAALSRISHTLKSFCCTCRV
jgi:hypothetical protein